MLAALMLLSALSIGADLERPSTASASPNSCKASSRDGRTGISPEALLSATRMQAGPSGIRRLVSRFVDGLSEWPEDARLRRQLSRAESVLQKGPMPIAFAPTWLTRRNLSMLGAACLVLAAASYSIGEQARHRRAGLVGVLAILLLFLSAVVIYQRRDAATFVEYYLVRTTTPLRLGNGPDYDEVPTASPLQPGQEVHVLGSRGGWSHVECPDEKTGWLKNDVLIR